MDVLDGGGDYTDIKRVNFYDKDEIVDVIHHEVTNEDDLQIYKINIAPKLGDLLERLQQTERIIMSERFGPEVDSGQLRLVTLADGSLAAAITRERE